MSDLNQLTDEAITLLKRLIETPSFSREEGGTAKIISDYLISKDVPIQTEQFNIMALNKYYDPARPTILLNSHHDTVKPDAKYTRDPFQADVIDGKLYGLGSNDAGGCLVSLIATFLHFYDNKDGQYNVIFAASAEEEISGTNGIEKIVPLLPPVDCAIVGEPTLMQMAVAERGLLVMDCVAHGKAGHAARNEGENALYKAMSDITWFRDYQFEKVSPLLGACRMSVTSIETENKAHNVVPAECRFVVDARINECYKFEEVLDIIREHVQSDVSPRSLRMRSTSISVEHPLIRAGLKLDRSCYGSPTTSDKALMPFPALKMGPGDSARSHTADEFIYVDEIRKGISIYTELVGQVL